MGVLGPPPQIDVFASEYRADPYPMYRRLREHAPVLRLDLGFWVITGYSAAAALLKETRLRRFVPPRPEAHAARAMESKWLMYSNPPAHTRRRRLITKAFTPRMVEQLRPRIEELTTGLLDRIEPGREVDLLAEFAYPLPVHVICELLGVPASDRPLFERASLAVGNLISTSPTEAQLDDAHTGTIELLEYFMGLIDDRRRWSSASRDDLLSALLDAGREEDDPLSDQEIAAIAALVLGAGHDTTVNLIGNGVVALLQHPSEMAKLRSDPKLVRPAVEEFLRYDSSAQTAPPSIATEELRIGDSVIPEGDVLFVIVGAANRDPERFPQPDSLDIERPDNRHLSFGGGIHGCLGPSLARLEAQIAFRALLSRFRRIELASQELEWRDNFTLRGLESLPVVMS